MVKEPVNLHLAPNEIDWPCATGNTGAKHTEFEAFGQSKSGVAEACSEKRFALVANNLL